MNGLTADERAEKAERERDEAQHHLAYHLADFRPGADMEATGDLAVDMAHYAERMRAERDHLASRVAAVEAERDRLATGVRALADDLARDGNTFGEWERDPYRRGWSRASQNAADDLRSLLGAAETTGDQP